MSVEPNARTPQYVGISRERFAGKKWRRPAGYGHAATRTAVPVVAAELAPAALRMPLAFVQEGGRFVLVAILSLTPGRNMLVAPDGRWLGAYIPASVRAYPFALVPQSGGDQVTLCIDAASGAVLDDGGPGEDFFDHEGNPATATKQALDLLIGFERSRKITDAAVSALADAGVIQPWALKIKSGDAERMLGGLYRIDEAALGKLPDEAVLKLHRTGAALAIAYAQMFSMGQVAIFEQFELLQQQLKPAAPVQPALPESLDSLFGIANDDTVRFR